MVIDLFTSRPSARQWSSISLHQDPLQSNGHWFLVSHWGPLRGNGHRSLYIKTPCEVMVIDFLCHIEALCEAMVIDLFTSRPSVKQWSLISYVTLRPSARQWSLFFFRIGTLYMVMVIKSFRYRPSSRHWSNLFFKKSKYKKNMVCQIVTIYMVMVNESFRYRPLLGINPIFSQKIFKKKKIFKLRPSTW